MLQHMERQAGVLQRAATTFAIESPPTEATQPEFTLSE
jgi:hypothetical protein